MNAGSGPSVLILGAGINGCSVARELVLNGVGVWLVDLNDIAFGATSRSSRLIHGGLRYLEYGDFRLVRESLAERARLLKLAPHLVEPLRLYIPVSRRRGGLMQSACRFLGASRSPLVNWLLRPLRRRSERGLWIVEMGLALYDRFAAAPDTPAHSVHDVSEPDVPRVDKRRYRWLCGYTDAQMRFPERYCVALLDDARQIAQENEVEFRVETYARAEFANSTVRATRSSGETIECAPALVINATGAWGDLTLRQLKTPAPRLFGGTKGSHFITHQPALRRAISASGVYAESDDGRLIFVLPFGDAVLVGTTDERFDEPPERTVASDAELQYLVSTVNHLFPDVGLTRADVTLTYSGVRPLPRQTAGSEGSISRDHFIAAHAHHGIPVLTLVGGKLTTSRAFGELVTDDVLRRLGRPRLAMTAGRYVPGGRGVPTDRPSLHATLEEIAARFRLDVEQVGAIWALCGTRVDDILRAQRAADGDPAAAQNIAGSSLPRTFARWVIAHEWVGRLDDLVERRLMLIYEAALSLKTLEELADLLVECNRLDPAQKSSAIAAAGERCERIYGRKLMA